MVYTLMKRMIARGDYDRAELMEKMEVFCRVGYLTAEECRELTALMA